MKLVAELPTAGRVGAEVESKDETRALAMTGKKSDQVLNIEPANSTAISKPDRLEVSQSPSYSGGGIDTEPVCFIMVGSKSEVGRQHTEVRLTPGGAQGDAVADWKAIPPAY